MCRIFLFLSFVAWIVPAPPSLAQGVLSAGENHTCMVNQYGKPFCWGANQSGQLGNGKLERLERLPNAVMSTKHDAPLVVSNISAGTSHTCARTAFDSALCWGSNYFGELGDNTANGSLFPVNVRDSTDAGPLNGVSAISTGAYFACAIFNKQVACWGANSIGQLGNGSESASSLPVTLDLDHVAALTTGKQFHACAVTEYRRATCWGQNFNGELGNGGTDDSSIPTDVLGEDGIRPLSNVKDISAGLFHTCALMADTRVLCWGSNNFGELGNGRYTSPLLLATPVIGISGGALHDVVAIAAGNEHTCALISDGSVLCWGDNSSGQLGDNSNLSSRLPVAVLDPSGMRNLANVVAIAAGSDHSCALQGDGTAHCWGNNAWGQLGNGTLNKSPLPVRVDFDTVFRDGYDDN